MNSGRRGTESPIHPDEYLPRQELAELVNTWIYEHHDQTIKEANANYIGQLERGKIRWPNKLYREAFRAIFNVPTDSALGFINARARRAAGKLDTVKRQQLIRGSAALGVGTLVLGPVAALLEGSEPPPIPARVGATDIEQTRIAARVFQSWKRTYDGGMAREAVRGQLRWSAGLLEASCPERLRPELYLRGR